MSIKMLHMDIWKEFVENAIGAQINNCDNTASVRPLSRTCTTVPCSVFLRLVKSCRALSSLPCAIVPSLTIDSLALHRVFNAE